MKTWLITGCSSGIGRGIAKAALEHGDFIAVTARNTDAISEFSALYPDKALVLALDVTDRNSMKAAVEQTQKKFGQIDVLVNNAGYGYRAAIEESEQTAVEQLFQTNVFGPVELMNLVLPQMCERKDGIIINVSSIGAVRAAVGNGFYSASKAALELVSDAVGKEAGELGIRVMIVEPGAFRTNFYDSLKGTDLEIKDYEQTAGKMRIENVTNDKNQPGDPERAGEVIVDLVSKNQFPKRLALGSDAVKIISTELEERIKEVRDWASISRKTDFS